jgi:hypothetical protein
MTDKDERSPLGDAYDQSARKLENRPDTVHATASIKTTSPLGVVERWTIETYRHPLPPKKNQKPGVEIRGDTILLEHGSGSEYLRLVIPPDVSDAIARQRDSLTTKNRKRGAQRAVQTRSERRGGK